MNMTRIIFTGAHGTGKTTILNHFKREGYKVITEVVRSLHSSTGIPINEEGTSESQKTIFNTYHDLLTSKESYISDRGLVDVMAYTGYARERGKVDQETYIDLMQKFISFLWANKDIKYVYFPIEFGVEDDGVRSIDREFQRDIDERIVGIMDDLEIPYMVVHGTPEERIEQVKKLLE